ncbi:MAG: metal-dependent hydrolase [Prevotella sp.]|nr:metal-dependent hydrolase [Alistipes senegalensis]MCM1358142.1 metal-dependent hydrolase [Prevotella sp.]MCM1473921.1 metal-dependent hydrolase [Muribaculaceae bacterium]
MNGNCHFVFGAALGSAFAMNTDKLEAILPNLTDSPETATLFVLGGLIGGIFPDIDNPISYIGKLTVPVSTVIGKFGELAGKTGPMHRGILHEPIVYITGLILSYLFCPSLVGLFLGCISHLYLDMFTPAGIPIFSVKHLRLAKIKSGSQQSIIFTWLNVIAVILLGIIL